LAVTVLFMLLSPAWAEESPPDKFSLKIASYTLARYDSNISLTDPDLGAGISISPQDTLGMDFSTTVARIEGYYRIRPKHAITFDWYSINSTGSKTIEEEFTWVDPDGGSVVIPVGAQVSSILEYDIFKVGYLWSFYRSDKVELGAGAGLHITRLKLDLDATTIKQPDPSTQKVNTTIPLPVLSLVLKYNVTPKFHWYLKSETFLVKFDDWTGSYRDNSLGLEYRAWKHVALGGGLSSNSLEVEEDTSTYKLRFDNTISGLVLYVAMYF